MKTFATDEAPKAIGPYSQAKAACGFVFVSGQTPCTPAGEIPEGIEAQADQSCRNVGAILKAAGSGFDKVVKTTCLSCVAVKDLPLGVKCEIEAIAEE